MSELANGRIPAIIDRTPTADGKKREKRVFEGQAIMLYLCQKYDTECKISYPFDTDQRVILGIIAKGEMLTRRQILGNHGVDDLDAERNWSYAG